jgi:hypothetical protein
MNNKIKLILFLICSTFLNVSMAQNCQKDVVGNIYCAPPNGTAVVDLAYRIVCARGQCIKAVTGQYVCSSEQGGTVVVNNAYQIKCYGECVKPTKELCQKM